MKQNHRLLSLDAFRGFTIAAMLLVNNTRLSVQPVTADEWKHICKLGGVKP